MLRLLAAGASADRDGRARDVRAAARRAVGGHGPRRRTGRVEPDRLARQHVGEAGHPARLPVRRHRRRVDGPRPLAVLRQGHAAAEAARPRRRRPHRARRIGGARRRVPRAGRHLHAADVREHRRLGRRRHRSSTRTRWSDRARRSAPACTSAPARRSAASSSRSARCRSSSKTTRSIGGNTGIYEGAIIKTRAVIAAGTVLTGSTPVYDLVQRRDHQADRRAAAGRSGRRRGRAGRARGDRGKRAGVGAVAGDAGHRQVPRLADRHAHGARGVDSSVRRPGRARRGRWSTSIRRPAAKAKAGALARRLPAGHRVLPSPSSRSTAAAFNVFADPRPTPTVVFSTHFDCVPPFFPSRVEGDRIVRPRLVRREGHSRGAGRGGRPAAARRRDARRPAVRRRRGARQRRRARGERVAPPGARFLDQRRADRQPARRWRRAACCGSGCVASGRAAHSSFPELGESAIDKLIDALVELRSIALPSDPDPRPHALHDRADRGRRGAERGLAVRRGGSDVSHGQRRGGRCAMR